MHSLKINNIKIYYVEEIIVNKENNICKCTAAISAFKEEEEKLKIV